MSPIIKDQQLENNMIQEYHHFMKCVALVDCNNFYASCERLFHPELKNRPLVVLSNNDGCIIARSNEAKELGIPMGAPLFQCRELIEKAGVIVRSSNYPLYGDLSARVMETLRKLCADVQVYSVDEAFLLIDPNEAPAIKKRIQQWTGIPVSIGIASTKTLAKVANKLAKKGRGLYTIASNEQKNRLLEDLPVATIWGIGSRLSRRLACHGIHSAKQLIELDDHWIRKKLSIQGLRTVYELRGERCFAFKEQPLPKKSICCSRSFGRPIDTLDELSEAAATFTSRAAAKARKIPARAQMMTLFVHLHPFNVHQSISTRIHLDEASHYTPHLITYAKQALKTLYRPGQSYRKLGVILEDLVTNVAFQPSLLPHKRSTKEQDLLLLTLDRLKGKPVTFAATGMNPKWKGEQGKISPRYTTNWNELLTLFT